MEDFLQHKFPVTEKVVGARLNPEDTGAQPSANEIQIGGDHYKSQGIQPWDFIVANNMGFLDGNVVKYVARYKQKNGLQDLEKARHYLDKLIEVEKAKGLT